MSLLSGTRLGPYEIVAAIGAGGMGEATERATRVWIVPSRSRSFQSGAPISASQMILVQNWFEESKARVPK